MSYNTFSHGHRCGKCWGEKNYSKAEREIFLYIKQNYKGIVIQNDRNQIINPITKYTLELDIWIPELNKAIEYNGTFWHNNTVRQYRDQIKQEQCKEKGIDLLVLKEDLWMLNKDWRIINNFLGVTL